MGHYTVTEVFYSLQGEGLRAGTPNVFVRFAGCNQTCRVETHGFDCDTQFTGGFKHDLRGLLDAILGATAGCGLVSPAGALYDPTARDVGVIFTGGEPMLQLDAALVRAVRELGFHTAVETNGSVALPDEVALHLDWLTVSPKTAEHALRVSRADEVKYVLHAGQALPKPVIQTRGAGRPLHRLLSPAFLPTGRVDPEALAWCIDLCKRNPAWRLSVQQHKSWSIR